MKILKQITVRAVAPYLVLILGFFTYFMNYSNPPNLFWDENYYVTAVEKYKKGIFFQESHPPLGKLIMFAGEKIWNPNSDLIVDFEKSDFARNIPSGYSFKGIRFFPVFFAWVNCVLFFILFLSVTRSAPWALVLSFLYAMDNALIVHSRGAMLDSIQIFGILVALIAYFKIFSHGIFSSKWAAILGAAIMWSTWTKLNGLVIILLLPLLILYPSGLSLKERIKKLVPVYGVSLISMLIFSTLVWGTHFSLGKKIEPALNNEGWYKASNDLKSIKLNPDENPNFVRNFYIELRDYVKYINNYATGVPRLNLCKRGENGSPFFWWPFGARAINYRWETRNSGQTVSYLYLVPNPVVWGIALLSVFLTFSYFLIKMILPNVSLKKEDEQHLVVMGILYFSYMLSIARIDRVMYTYHYFVPLIFSFVLVAKWLPVISERLKSLNIRYAELSCQLLLLLGISFTWYLYSPFTYYKPISCEDFKKRALTGWQMKPVQCRDYKDETIYQPASFSPPPHLQTKKTNQASTSAPQNTSTPKNKNQPRTTNSLPSKPQR